MTRHARFLAVLCLWLFAGMVPAAAQQDPAPAAGVARIAAPDTSADAAADPAAADAESPALTDLQALLQRFADDIAKPSRRTIGAVIDEITASGLPGVPVFLQVWGDRELYLHEPDGLFYAIEEQGDDQAALIELSSGDQVAVVNEDDLDQIRPNSGVRELIGAALVKFQLTDTDPARRREALAGIDRAPDASHLEPLRAALETEDDPALAARMTTLERLLTIAYGETDDARIAAIESLSGSLSVESRGALNPVLTTRRIATAGPPPEGANVATELEPGSDALSEDDAWALLVSADLAPATISTADRNAALIAAIEQGFVGGIAVHQLDTEQARDRAYAALAADGGAAPRITGEDRAEILASHSYYDIYVEPSAAVTGAAEATLAAIRTQVALNQVLDLVLDGLSLASIYFLAAIGLAITFGVMGVINMAHGEFIMMGAYTGYVVQQFVPDYTLSIALAIPLAFAVTFAAGVAMERLVIRWLYSRPLETLLATFGISIALQQLAKNIFGTQARPLTSPGWLDGAWVLNDVVSISYIRIAIFVLGLTFFLLLLFILNRTRLGLEVRAVTQNPRMASSMGINPDRINMLTFGLGSGIAGIAGVAIGLFAQVTSEIGQQYIVQSFMTVVVGGVGNVWGTLAGATMIGFLQKGIEWMNPSNTLAAQTYMIIFIIIFIQFRPKGIIALKGRAAGD